MITATTYILPIIFVLGLVIFLWFVVRMTSWSTKYNQRREEYLKRKAEDAHAEKERQDRDIIEQSYRLAALTEVLRQARLMGDTATIDKVENDTYDGPLPERRDDGAYLSIYDDLRILPVAGINYRGNLTAYVGHFNGVLVPEPKNEYDPFAIMVKVEDGKHIGYVRENQTDLVRNLVGAPQPLGERQPTIFPPYRIEGYIDKFVDEDDEPRFSALIYIKRKK